MIQKATLILTEDEVRDELSLDSDSLSTEQALALSQFASDKILNTTNYDFGKDNNSIAKITARTIVYQTFYHQADSNGVLTCLLGDLQDIARKELKKGGGGNEQT